MSNTPSLKPLLASNSSTPRLNAKFEISSERRRVDDVRALDVLTDLRRDGSTIDLHAVFTAKENSAVERATLSHNVQTVLAQGSTAGGDILEKARKLLGTSKISGKDTRGIE